MKLKLTDALCKSIEPPDSGRLRVYDEAQKGFYLQVTPTGHRAYYARYHIHGLQRRALVGTTDEMSTSEARKRAATVILAARDGQDEIAERANARAQASTLRDLWPLYREQASARWSPRTGMLQDDIWESRIAIHRMSRVEIADLNHGMIVRWHADALVPAPRKDGSTPEGETPVRANQALRLLSAMMRYAIEMEMRPAPNPCARVKRHPERKRETWLDDRQCAALFDAIDEEEALGGRASVVRFAPEELEAPPARGGKGMKETESRGISTHAAALFRLLLMTGARLSSIMEAEWDWVDLERGMVLLPIDGQFKGARVIALSEDAVAELRRLRAIRTQKRWVIEGARPGSPLVNPRKPWLRVCARAGLSGIRLHDLRHSFASIAVTGGASLPFVQAALNHRHARTTERYAHLQADTARTVAEEVAERIRAARAKRARAKRAGEKE